MKKAVLYSRGITDSVYTFFQDKPHEISHLTPESINSDSFSREVTLHSLCCPDFLRFHCPYSLLLFEHGHIISWLL